MDSLSLLQGILPTQGSNPGLPHCRQIFYQLSHKESPRILEWVTYSFSSRCSQPRKWSGGLLQCRLNLYRLRYQEAHLFQIPRPSHLGVNYHDTIIWNFLRQIVSRVTNPERCSKTGILLSNIFRKQWILYSSLHWYLWNSILKISVFTIVKFIETEGASLCGSVVKNLPANAGRPRFNPWVRMPWRRKWQPTLVFLPGKSHAQTSLWGYSPWGCRRVGHDLATKQQRAGGGESMGLLVPGYGSSVWRWTVVMTATTIMQMYFRSVICILKKGLNGKFRIVYILPHTYKKMITLLTSNSSMSFMCFCILNVLNYTVRLFLSLDFYLDVLCEVHPCHYIW